MTEPDPTPLDVVAQWHLRAWRGDLGAVDDLVADTLIRHSRDGTQRRSHADVKSDLRAYQQALGIPVVELHDRVVDGDKVWSRLTLRGANLRTEEARTLELLQVHRVEHGRIAEVWTLHADAEWIPADPERAG